MEKELYHARNNQVFMWTDDNLAKEELFMTVHKTSLPGSLEEQALYIVSVLNKVS